MNIKEPLDEESLDMSLEDMALEVIDMLGVAIRFAGGKKQHIQKLIELYSTQIDKFYETLPQDAPYGQNEIAEIIISLKKDYPQYFN